MRPVSANICSCIAVLGLSLLAVGCEQAKSGTVAKNVQVQPVKVLEVNALAVNAPVKLIGYLDAGDRADLSFQVGGFMEKLHVSIGQEVKQGDLIAELDGEDHRLLLEIKKAEFKLAKANFERAKRLYKQALISKDSYEHELSNYDSAKASLSVAQSDLNNTKIYADFDGIIAAKLADSFQVVAAGQTIVSLANPNLAEVKALLPVELYNQFHSDGLLQGRYEMQLAGSPSVRYEAKFKEMTSQPDEETNSYALTLVSDSLDKHSWLPGMSAEILLPQPQTLTSYQLHESAWVSKQGQKARVFVYDPVSEAAVLTDVTLDQAGNVIQGLANGDLVVVAGNTQLKHGQAIRPWLQERGI